MSSAQKLYWISIALYAACMVAFGAFGAIGAANVLKFFVWFGLVMSILSFIGVRASPNLETQFRDDPDFPAMKSKEFRIGWMILCIGFFVWHGFWITAIADVLTLFVMEAFYDTIEDARKRKADFKKRMEDNAVKYAQPIEDAEVSESF